LSSGVESATSDSWFVPSQAIDNNIESWRRRTSQPNNVPTSNELTIPPALIPSLDLTPSFDSGVWGKQSGASPDHVTGSKYLRP